MKMKNMLSLVGLVILSTVLLVTLHSSVTKNLQLKVYFSRMEHGVSSTQAPEQPEPISCEATADFPCVMQTLGTVKFPVCLYTAASDGTVSAWFHRLDYWNAHTVLDVIEELKKHPAAQFVDIGANVGAFTLGVAHTLRRQVVSAEPTKETYRRLRHSVCIGNLSSVVRVVNKAITNDRRTARLAIVPGNVGATVVLNNTDCVLTRDQIRCVNETTETITLDDLLPQMTSKTAIMKVDAEGSEIKMFNEKTASKFFKEIDVLIIHFEFFFYSRFYTNTPERKKAVDVMVAFFQNRGFTAFAPPGKIILPPEDWTKWGDDIIWKK